MRNNTKRIVTVLIVFIMCAWICSGYFCEAEKLEEYNDYAALRGVNCSAAGMAMIELDSGRLIAAKDKDRRLPMASTTKIVTAITVIENCEDLNKIVEVPNEAVGVEGSSIYLKRGERLSVKDLLYGLMLQSGNDCAVALAVHIAGSIENFATMMNDAAERIGAKNSHFVNPHGLHSDEHYTTAYDLALISAYAMRNETFKNIVGTKVYKITTDNQESNRVIINKNKFLNLCAGGNGIKTGFTKKAGRCLVASAQRNGRTLICVVLDCGAMFEECSRLVDIAFNSLIMSDIISVNTAIKQVKVANGEKNLVGVGVESVVNYPFTVEEISRLKINFELPDELQAPINKGEKVGKINFYLNNRLLFSEDLYTIDDVAEEGFWEITEDNF